jgi:hypothetical protein
VSLHRRAAKRDAAEGPIVEAARAFGFSVDYLSKKGMPDLLLGKDGLTRVVEVKSGNGKLTEDQVAWWAKWRGNSPIVLRSVEDVALLAAGWTRNDAQSS